MGNIYSMGSDYLSADSVILSDNESAQTHISGVESFRRKTYSGVSFTGFPLTVTDSSIPADTSTEIMLVDNVVFANPSVITSDFTAEVTQGQVVFKNGTSSGSTTVSFDVYRAIKAN